MKKFVLPTAVAVLLAVSAGALAAGNDAARKAIVDGYAAAAGPGFAGFSADRGRALYMGPHTGGKPETPACATCHGPDPRLAGKHYRTGREILPMAVSTNPDRFTVTADVEKHFARDCMSVLGRECTPIERGDFIAYLSGL